MTIDTLIDGIFIREGDSYAEPPKIDQPTGRGGITLPTLQSFCHAMQPGRVVTTADLQALSHEEARAIISWLLGELNREMGLGAVSYEPLKLHLLDFGYNSGGERALRWLQRVLNVAVTGTMDLGTVMAVQRENPFLVHHALLFARMRMVHGMTFEEGLENRILSFSRLPA